MSFRVILAQRILCFQFQQNIYFWIRIQRLNHLFSENDSY